MYTVHSHNTSTSTVTPIHLVSLSSPGQMMHINTKTHVRTYKLLEVIKSHDD